MGQLYTRTLRSIQQFAALRKRIITRCFFLVELALIAMIFSARFLVQANEEMIVPITLVGLKFGTLSALLLALTLLPGMLGRFRVFLDVRVILVMFRRHFGILTWLSAVTHWCFVVIFPQAIFGITPLQTFEFYGFVAMVIGLPLWLTSNDFSVRILKAWWKRIHRLAYLMLIFAALHTLGTSPTIGLFLCLVVGAELLSFGVKYFYDHHSSRR